MHSNNKAAHSRRIHLWFDLVCAQKAHSIHVLLDFRRKHFLHFELNYIPYRMYFDTVRWFNGANILLAKESVFAHTHTLNVPWLFHSIPSPFYRFFPIYGIIIIKTTLTKAISALIIRVEWNKYSPDMFGNRCKIRIKRHRVHFKRNFNWVNHHHFFIWNSRLNGNHSSKRGFQSNFPCEFLWHEYYSSCWTIPLWTMLFWHFWYDAISNKRMTTTEKKKTLAHKAPQILGKI